MNPAEATRQLYWNVSHIWVMYTLLIPMLAVFGYGFYRHLALWRRGLPLERFDRPAERIRLLIKQGLVQSRTARVSSGARALVGVSAVLLLLLGTGFVAMRRISSNPQLVAQRSVTDSDEDTAPSLQPLLEQQSTLIGKLNLLAKHQRAGTSPTGAEKQSPGEMAKFAASLVKSADSDLAQLKTVRRARGQALARMGRWSAFRPPLTHSKTPSTATSPRCVNLKLTLKTSTNLKSLE